MGRGTDNKRKGFIMGPKDDQGGVFADGSEQLLAMHTMTDGGEMVTLVEHIGCEWRGILIGMLYTKLPLFNELIEQLQLAGNDLTKRREAFAKGATAVLENCYEHPLCEQWRVIASRTVKTLDEEAFQQYGAVKYAGGEAPDREQRIKAYNLIIQRFIELSYNLTGL
jgi:hypothetical protein